MWDEPHTTEGAAQGHTAALQTMGRVGDEVGAPTCTGLFLQLSQALCLLVRDIESGSL